MHFSLQLYMHMQYFEILLDPVMCVNGTVAEVEWSTTLNLTAHRPQRMMNHKHTCTHTHTHTRKWYEVGWPNGQTPPLESGSGLFGGSTQVHCTTASETHTRKTTDTGPCKCWFLLLSPGYHLKFKLQNMEKYNH